MTDNTPVPPSTPGPKRPTPRRMEDEPTGAVPVERKPGSMSKGLRNALIVIGAVVVAATLSALFGFFVLADKAEKENVQATGSVDCSYISDADLSDVLGTTVDAFQLGTDAGLAAQLTDSRVKIDGATCLASGQSSDLSVSFAVATGGDAEQTFADQKALAESPSDNSEPYLQSTETDLGDEAFCTSPDGFGYSGVLVRTGKRLAYASVIPDDPEATAEAKCDLAKSVAAALIES